MEYAYVKRIRDLREDHDMSQRQVAKILGTSQTMYARYERSANELPIRHLIALCRLYHVSADYILGLTERKELKRRLCVGRHGLGPLPGPCRPDPKPQRTQRLRPSGIKSPEPRHFDDPGRFMI